MKKSLTNKVGEVRELTKKDFKNMRPLKEVLPELAKILPKRKRGERGSQKRPTKVAVTLRYSPDVLNYFKSTGEGWQVRMNEVLKSYVKKKSTHRAA